MTPAALEAVKAHAAECYPAECCGVLLRADGREVYHPCRSLAPAHDEFRMYAEDYAEAESMGEVTAIVHSHPDASANPSEADRQGCEVSGLPWIILGWPSGVVVTVEPCGWQAPIIGRTFHWGVQDCYALARDYYRREFGILLPDYPRDSGIWASGSNALEELFSEAGFVRIEAKDLQEGDALLMGIRSPFGHANHCAVWHQDDSITHHLLNRPSCREPFHPWRRYMTHALRHVER